MTSLLDHPDTAGHPTHRDLAVLFAIHRPYLRAAIVTSDRLKEFQRKAAVQAIMRRRQPQLVHALA